MISYQTIKFNSLRKIGQMEEYIGLCITHFSAFFLADVMRRVLKLLRELLFFRKHYLPEEVPRTILYRSFGYNRGSILVIVVFVFLAVFRWARTSQFPLPSFSFLKIVPFYLVLFYVDFGKSTLDYSDWLRGSHGLDYAEGMASNYFYGYLKLSLPLDAGQKSIQERIELYEAKENVTFAFHKLLILMPNDMYVHGKIQSRFLEKAKPLEIVARNRAGTMRQFTTDVYRIKQPINGTTFYIAAEGATPLLSYFDSMQSQRSWTWEMCEMKREVYLKFYKHLKALLKAYPEMENLVELLPYNTYTSDGRKFDVGEMLMEYVRSTNT